jgi:prepilin-type N-terminal cleavage/methylation domain-containing protein
LKGGRFDRVVSVAGGGKMRKNYGFSLVELTIVLIIVGIIIAMFMGGVSFMEKARIKTELGKLTKFSSAVTTYYTQSGDMPDEWNPAPSGLPSRSYEPVNFVDFGLTAEDFRSNYSVGKSENSYVISSCWLNSQGISPNHTYNYYDNTSVDYPSHVVCIYLNNFYGRFICNLEKSIDDKLVVRNDGLLWDTQNGSGLGAVSNSYDNVSCDSILDTSSGPYGYKIFQY